MSCFGFARRTFVAVMAFGVVHGASGHHSYAMFDGTRTVTVKGSVAKLEWTNPHVFVWMYVPSSASASGFDLYAFENGSPNVLTRMGWSKDTFAVGEELTIEYWPLADGRTGGHFSRAVRADGSEIRGAGGPRGVDGSLPPDPPAARP